MSEKISLDSSVIFTVYFNCFDGFKFDLET